MLFYSRDAAFGEVIQTSAEISAHHIIILLITEMLKKPRCPPAYPETVGREPDQEVQGINFGEPAVQVAVNL